MKPGDGPTRTLVKSVTKARVTLPPHAPGLRIGLFGGSFNPPHEAHRAVSLLAMKKLQLDRLWWLVTPGNPLKDKNALPPIGERIAMAQAMADHPRIDVTGFEAVIGAKYSYDTIAWLLKESPGTHFVWIMGADNLKDFHRWKHWRDIFMMLPIAVVDRGGLSLKAASGPAAISFAKARIPENQASRLPVLPAPAWVYLHGVKSDLSSTRIRAEKEGSGH
ncbi:nicotinate-nucleotide adenylyltransferase [Pseudorhodoplanes sinuspersici]|uniref:Probable nicotinate-nucleotide adenylyltransferase n=1 Tax=Pseudorhodoplanes sinuspersici TaxID=1235591 RepID=A0A1W6ZNU2_9HYPH|nr:nicotinate-nucleotide adenylyltransferase [Pseudorhodoplanes sinuspersici]ARP98907.1 nicotinic acid mononucleotide adenylyltransferase [Pseudorhodoplanes sinuspersici]RKE69465.1 nicotinate-nucleotide adenylyltransferase [Pseudorhodoplanes sinuspersici]